MSKKEKKIFPHNIIDIRFQGGKSYILKEINLTSGEVEKQLSAITYTGQKRKLSDVAEKAKMPPFALAFYKLLFEFQKIPTEKELTTYYEQKYFTKVDDKNFTCDYQGETVKVDKEGLEGRLLRTYPSLIRDFHFYLKCTESGAFEEVKYSLSQDYFDGIDLQLKYKGETFGASLFVDTARANSFKEKKYQRHEYADMKEITLVIDLKKSTNKVSNFILYSDTILNELISKIQNAKKN